MILKALQSEIFRFKFYSLSSKILKIPGPSDGISWFYRFEGSFLDVKIPIWDVILILLKFNERVNGNVENSKMANRM